MKHRRAKALDDMFRLRMVELFAFFVIVFVAKEIANFTYATNYFIGLFVVAVLLQLNGQLLWGPLGKGFGWSDDRTSKILRWHSSIVDFLVVMGIVYLTGTIESPFLFLLVVPLFFVSHLFPWRIAVGFFLTGALTAVGLLGYLELHGHIAHFSCHDFTGEVYRNRDYYVGALLVLTGFLSLIMFLSNAFQDYFQVSMDILRRREQESKDRIFELARLYDISLGVNAVMTVETLLKMVAKEATLLLEQSWGSVVLFNSQREITHSEFVGVPDEFQRYIGSSIRKGGLTEWICDNGRPVVVEDVLADERASTGEFLLATNIRSVVGLPLSTGDTIIGAIYVGDFVKKQFEDRHLRLLTIMCDQLAIAIAKSKLYESMQHKLAVSEKEIRKLEKVNHLKSEYVSHVSHELRTPLTSIKAYLETLSLHIDDPSFTEKTHFLNIVSKEAERLIRIVNDILDVSNIEFGERSLQRSTFNIEEVIHEVVYMLQPTLEDKKIRLSTELPENLPRVDADKDLMTQVVINLISNAVKYSPENRSIKVKVREEAVDLVICIEDEGIGIPEAQVAKIFDKYYRVKSDQSRKHDGVGLGLAIVKNIVEQHGGTISVESKENVGSKFTVTVPKEQRVTDLVGYISQLVNVKTDLHDMLTLIVRLIAEVLSAKIVSLMLLDQNRSELFIKVSYGLDEWIVDQTRVKVGEGIAGKVAETGKPLLINNIEKNEVYMSPNNPQYETMSLLSAPLLVNDTVVGVINVNNKTSGEVFTQDDANLLMSFGERISKAFERLRTAENAGVYLQGTIDAFKKMLDKQNQTKHIERIVDLAVKVSRRRGLSEKEVKVVQYVASVHDIGMTKISDDILNKTFDLTPDEIREIQSHPQRGTELLRPLEFVELVSNIILHHHERVDGNGYPMGLRGDQIPMGSRILAVIDAYHSMTSEKPYRPVLSTLRAAKELVECSGKQFDPEIVDCFIDILEEQGQLSDDQRKALKKMIEGVARSTSY